jgi:hypothetical protein
MAFSDTARWYAAVRAGAKFNDPVHREEAENLSNFVAYLTRRHSALAEHLETLRDNGARIPASIDLADADIDTLESLFTLLQGFEPGESFGQAPGWDAGLPARPLDTAESFQAPVQLADSWGVTVQGTPAWAAIGAPGADYSGSRVLSGPATDRDMPRGWEGYTTPDTYSLRAGAAQRSTSQSTTSQSTTNTPATTPAINRSSSSMPPGWEGYDTPDTYGLRAAGIKGREPIPVLAVQKG